jgi:F-type H+-transporting ATPase subunit b
MNVFAILLQHAEEAGAEPSVFNLSTNVSFWTLVIFLVLLFVLAKFAFPPILGYAAAREERIQKSLDDAKHQREEAERLLAQQREELADARQQAQQVIAEGRQAADEIRQQLIEQARTEQQEIIARALRDIEAERGRAVEAVRREAVEVAVAAASRLVGQRLGSDADLAIVESFLGGVAADGGSPAGAA